MCFSWIITLKLVGANTNFCELKKSYNFAGLIRLPAVAHTTPLSFKSRKMAAASGLLSDASKLAGNVVTVDDEGALDFETQGLERVWKVYSGQLQGLTPPTDLVEKSVRVTCLVTIAISAFFWIWAFSNLVSLGDPDIGFVAFALPLACNVWGWQSTRDSFAADERLH